MGEDDESEPMLNGRALSELKVVELKEELGKRGLSKIGNKNMLYERLKEHLVGAVTVSDESEQESLVKPAAEEGESPSANPFVAEYLAKQQVALLAARKDAEAARRASDESTSSPQDKSPPVSRRSDSSKRSESEQQLGTPERRITRRSPRLGSPQKDHEKAPGGEVNGKDALNDGENVGISIKKSNEKNKLKEEDQPTNKSVDSKDALGKKDVATQEVSTSDKRNVRSEGKESSLQLPEAKKAERERRKEAIAEAASEGISVTAPSDTRLNEMSKKEPSKDTHLDETKASSSSFLTSAKQLPQDGSVKVKQKISEKRTSSDIVPESDSSTASSKLAASAANTTETNLEPEGRRDSSKREPHAKESVKAVDEMETGQTDDTKRDQIQSRVVSEGDDVVLGHPVQKKAGDASSPALTVPVPEEVEENSYVSIGQKLPRVEDDSQMALSPTSSNHSNTSTTESKDSIAEGGERRWKGKDGLGDREDVVMVDVNTNSKSSNQESERAKVVDGKMDESHEASSPSVSDESLEVSQRREERSASPSPSDRRVAASVDLDQSDDFKERAEELDYEEGPQQPASDSAHEKISERVSNKVEVSETSTRKTSRTSEGRVRTAIHESNDAAARRATVDGFVRERSVTPARYPVNQVLMIRQLTRPFTSKQLQQMLSIFGTIVEGGFWIDNIKSTCIVKYSSVEEAIVARGRLHNVIWPPHSPKALKVDYSDDEGLARHIASDKRSSETKSKRASGETRSLPEAMATSTLRVSVSVNREERSVQPSSARDRTHHKDRERDHKAHDGASERKKVHTRSLPTRDSAPSEKRKREERSDTNRDERKHGKSPEPRHVAPEPEKSVKTADELFKKTTTQPAIYYVALTDEQIVERAKRKAAEAEMLAAKRAAAALSSKKETKEKDDKTKSTVIAEGVRRARSRSPRAARTTHRSSRSRSPRHRR